jgi:ABC-type branched-subunit amino acid transport system ATPase component/MFS family permease
VSDTREERRAEARRRLGIGTAATADRPTESLRRTFAADRLKWYPLLALGLLAVVDVFQGYAFTVLAPEISGTLGISRGAFTGLVAAKTVAVAVAPLPIAALTQRVPRRALLAVITAVAWSVVAIATGYVILVWGLLLVVVLDGLTTGSAAALHQPLLLDSYPASTRVRVLSAYQGANAVGNVLAPLGVALLAGALGFTWRGVFIIFGLLSLASVLLALRLRDPGFGRFDEDRIRSVVDDELPEEVVVAAAADDADTELGFFEVVRRVMLVPTVRRLLLALAMFGVLLVPYQTFLFFFLEERWGLGPGGRGVFFAGAAAASIASLVLFGRIGERRFQSDPGGLLRSAGWLLALGVGLVCAGGLVPIFPVMLAMFAAGAAIVALLLPSVYTVLYSVIPSQMRPHAAALAGIFLGGVGGVFGAVFMSGIDRRFGVTGALVALLIPGLIGSLLLATTGRLVASDLDRMIDEVIEDEDTRTRIRSGEHLPLLQCRAVDYSYGQLQVLFGVDFTVDDGEMVALLGVNGAGKSTLLRAISGLGLPSAGSIRWRGTDITYLDAERRVPLGISQVPGGRAVFGPLSVVDNLRGFAHTMHRSGRDVDAGLDRCFEAFPRLAERRNQAASTLSGGEQQMLALSKALLLQPRLLLIDELSLGLAPIIVEQLLAMVREINQGGTAVVLVEQSVNIALGLVDHAYFMEKGQIRFDGVASELLDRDDLLRAVFLEGAGAHT